MDETDDTEEDSRTSRNRHVSRDRELVEKVAQRSFFHQGRPSWRGAGEVAKDKDLEKEHPGLTPHAVLACQRAAVDDGIVSILFHLSHERLEVLRLEEALHVKFGVKTLLVPGYPNMLKPLPLEHLKDIGRAVTLLLAQKAAEYVRGVLTGAASTAGEYRIGVAWGRTMHHFARAMASLPPGPRPARLKVYPIVGIVQAAQTLPLQANMIASDLASTLGAEAEQLPCPAIVTSEEEEVIVKHHQVQAALAALEDLRLVLTGLGPIEGALDAGDIMLSPDPEENAKLFRNARAVKATGEICGWCFDRSGNEVRTPYRSVGLGIPGLKRIATDEDRKGRRVVIVAGGDKRRILPLLAALEGGYASTLVTDTVTARVLFGEEPTWDRT